MIDSKPMVALCEDMPEYNLSVDSYSDYITLFQFDGDERQIIEVASPEQAHDLISILRAAMALNGWDNL
jgi:hypothetical protein